MLPLQTPPAGACFSESFELLKASLAGLGALIGILGGLLISGRTVAKSQQQETDRVLAEANRIEQTRQADRERECCADVIAAANAVARSAADVVARFQLLGDPKSGSLKPLRASFEEKMASLDSAVTLARLTTTPSCALAAIDLVTVVESEIRPFVMGSPNPDDWRRQHRGRIRNAVVNMEDVVRDKDGIGILARDSADFR